MYTSIRISTREIGIFRNGDESNKFVKRRGIQEN